MTLKQHLIVHSSVEKPSYKCKKCPKLYSWLSGLKKHEKSHISNTEKDVDNDNNDDLNEFHVPTHEEIQSCVKPIDGQSQDFNIQEIKLTDEKFVESTGWKFKAL